MHKRKLLLGLLLIFGGAIYTKLIRDLLFIESSLERVGDDIGNKLIGNHIHLFDNIRDLFFNNFASMDIVNSLIFFGIILYLAVLIPRFLDHHYKAFIMVLVILVSILISGRVNETRMLIILIPFMLFFHLDIGVEYFTRAADFQSSQSQ